MISPARVELKALRRVHEMASHAFPHAYLDEGLGAIGLFLHDELKNAGYRGATPTNSVTFASVGVDGIHFSVLSEQGQFDPMSPVVITIPMDFEDPNRIVGESLYDVLCLGCRNGFAGLANLTQDEQGTLADYGRETPPEEHFDARGPAILKMMTEELGLIPWTDVRNRFAELQERLASRIRVSDD